MHLYFLKKLLVSCNEFCLIIPTKLNEIGMPFCCFIHMTPLSSLPSILCSFYLYNICYLFAKYLSLYIHKCIYSWKQVVLILAQAKQLFPCCSLCIISSCTCDMRWDALFPCFLAVCFVSALGHNIHMELLTVSIRRIYVCFK